VTRSRAADTGAGALLAVLLLALNVASVSSQLGFLHKAKQVKEYDHWRYIEMSRAEHGRPELQREPPYCYRLAVPWLAGRLGRAGLSENAAFFTLTNAALFGFLLLLWLHLRDLGFSLPLRVAGLLVTGLTQGALRWSLYQYWMTDPAALFLVMLAFFLVERRRHAMLAATSLLSAFVRETCVLVYPYVFLHELRRRLNAAGGADPEARRRWPTLRRSALPAAALALGIAALPALVLVAIRLAVEPLQPDSFVSGIVDSMRFRWAHRADNQAYVLTVGSFGVLVPLVLLFPGRVAGLARRHFDRAAFVLFVYATLTISNNNERPLAYALPALVPAALWCLRRWLDETRLPATPVLTTVVLLQLLFWLGQRFTGSGISIYQPVNWTTVVAMSVAWLSAQAARRLPPRRAPAAGTPGAS
jgi:hypothetical protein